jgi:hypothetical protein
MKRIFFLILIFLVSRFSVNAQKQENLFEQSFTLLNNMLVNEDNYSFKKAVFSVENAYLEGSLDTVYLNKQINTLKRLSYSILKSKKLEYSERDKEIVNIRASIFAILCDTIPIDFNGKILKYEPFGYDFSDIFGHKIVSNLFVSKLLDTRKGNCHSLPYLYKILAEEIGIEANLALAPNHIYIKHRSIKDGWYNTELTSGIFPMDSWIMASGFVHIDAISNGIYMKALNNRESIALVLIDLADNYNSKFPKNDGQFVLKCCEKAISSYPNFATALILRAETHKTQMKKEQNKDKAKLLLLDLENEYAHIHKIGYRNMPEDMYLNWLVTLKTERSKYENKNLNTFDKK